MLKRAIVKEQDLSCLKNKVGLTNLDVEKSISVL